MWQRSCSTSPCLRSETSFCNKGLLRYNKGDDRGLVRPGEEQMNQSVCLSSDSRGTPSLRQADVVLWWKWKHQKTRGPWHCLCSYSYYKSMNMLCYNDDTWSYPISTYAIYIYDFYLWFLSMIYIDDLYRLCFISKIYLYQLYFICITTI